MLPSESAASSTPPAAAEPCCCANAGTATWTTPTAVPNTSRTQKTVRMPDAASGPSQPTSCASPRKRREGAVAVKANAEPAPSAAATSTATEGESTATIPATIAGAVTTATSKTIATSAYAVARCSGSRTSIVHSERIAAGSCGSVSPPHSAHAHSTVVLAPAWAASTSAASAGRCPAAAARSTRVWP
jgi:hypothetical protein